jgi:hypothetical protein
MTTEEKKEFFKSKKASRKIKIQELKPIFEKERA